MSVPLKSPRSLRSKSRRRKAARARAGVKPPRIFIEPDGGSAQFGRVIAARIQLRKAKYRYLVWWENGRKREFYLGQVKSVPLQEAPNSPAPASSTRSGAPARAGVRK